MIKYWTKLLKWIDGFKKNPASKVGKTQFPDGRQYSKYDQAMHLAVYTVDVWAYASIRAIARAVSQLPLLVQEQQDVDGQQQWVDVESGELYDMMNKPNPDEPTKHLIGRWVTSLLSTGNGYLLYDSTDYELYYLRPDYVKIHTDKMGRLDRYEITDNITTVIQSPPQVLHIKLVNPEGDFEGFPPSHVVRSTILTKLALSKYIKSYFENDTLPGTTLSTEQDLLPDQIEEMRQDFNRIHRGSGEAFKLAILPSGMKLDRLSHNLKDLIPDQLYKLIREEVLAAYGVPHVMVGVLDDASYSNADIQKKLFYENSILPLISEIESFLNLQLVPQFGNGLRLKFDVSAIQALQEQPADKAERLNKLINGRNQILTVNEARIELGYDPLDGFDELNTAPDLSGFSFGEDNEEDVDEEEDIDEDEKRLNIIKKRWKVHHKKVLSIEKEYAGIMVKFFDEQQNRVLARLTDLSFDGKFLSSVLKHEIETMEMKSLFEDTNVLFNKKRENRLLKKATLPKTKLELAIAGQQGVDNVGKKDLIPMRRKGQTFRVTEPAVAKVLKQFQNRMEDINNTTYESIKSIIQSAYDEGLSVDEVSTAIKQEYNFINKVRSKRIAKTEMNGIVNAGNWLGAKQGGATHKEWICAFLPDSRLDHQRADSDKVKIGEPFIVGDDLMMYPGDPNASVGNVVNCYCSTVNFEA